MSTFVETDHPRDHPTGRTRFSDKANSGPEGGLTAAPAKPFVFDGDYRNNEQVRPFFAEYSAVRAELDAAGEHPYNNRFSGRIPSLATTNYNNGNTAIYLLQTMHDLDALAARKAGFLAGGGVDAHSIERGKSVRGTVVVYGFRMDETGWKEFKDARLARNGRNQLFIIPKGKRNELLVDGPAMIHIDGPKRRPRT